MRDFSNLTKGVKEMSSHKNMTLAKLAEKIEELMPPIVFPELGGILPAERLEATTSVLERLTDASVGVWTANDYLGVALRETGIYYHHRSGTVVMQPMNSKDQRALKKIMRLVETAGAQAVNELSAAKKTHKEWIAIFHNFEHQTDDTFRRQQISVVLSRGCQTMNEVVQALSAFGKAFLASTECRRQILELKGQPEQPVVVNSNDVARRCILTGIALHQSLVSQIAAFSAR